MVACKPCADCAKIATQPWQTREHRLQNVFVGWNSGVRDLFHASGRRIDSSRCHGSARNDCSGFKNGTPICAARRMDNSDLARGRQRLHGRDRRLAGSASLLPLVTPAYRLMNKLWILVLIAGFSLLHLIARAQTGENVDVRAGINHGEFERLLNKYVNDQGLVNYGAWKQDAADISALDNYLKQFADKIDNAAQENERAASLVNAYNAFVLRWILSGYPIESIWQLKDSFTAKRYDIGGGKVSLDDIEHGTLRPLIGYRAHAVLVCAARSCPPLQRFAYTADKFEEQDDRAYRAWLAREDMNRFLPNERKVEISSIFKWFKDDFEKAGGIPKIFGRYAPPSVRDFAAGGKYEIKYLLYNWGLNDQGPHGRDYSKTQLILDNIFK